MKITMTIEVEVKDGFCFADDEEKNWFKNEVLVANGTLILHSNEIGDEIGVVTNIFDIRYI